MAKIASCIDTCELLIKYKYLHAEKSIANLDKLNQVEIDFKFWYNFSLLSLIIFFFNTLHLSRSIKITDNLNQVWIANTDFHD